MVFLLAQLILLYLKNNILPDSQSFTYLIAIGLPSSALITLGALFLYQKYVSKLNQSHPKAFNSLLALLVLFSISSICFVLLFSIYLQNPSENRELLGYALIPYYLATFIWTAFFIYLSPGLLDKINGVPGYQFAIFCVYTSVLLI